MHASNTPLGTSGTTIATLTLPIGSSVVTAKLYIRASNVGSYVWLANCTLSGRLRQ